MKQRLFVVAADLAEQLDVLVDQVQRVDRHQRDFVLLLLLLSNNDALVLVSCQAASYQLS